MFQQNVSSCVGLQNANSVLTSHKYGNGDVDQSFRSHRHYDQIGGKYVENHGKYDTDELEHQGR